MGSIKLILLALLLSLCLAACAPSALNGQPPGTAEDEDVWRILLTDPKGANIWNFTENDLAESLKQSGLLSYVYSTINNWPSTRFYAAEGYAVADILKAAGLYETAQTITFRAADGYEARFTAEQLFSPQYHYPQAGESPEGAEPVYPIIAYRWREGTKDISELYDNKPCLIIGQRDYLEHNNPAFVVGLTEIQIDDAPCGQWPVAATFPLPGLIAAGETVKLQHPDYGLVKLHYTLDGSEPTPLSPLYNPSTYQPELTTPIPILQTTIIKVLVRGYGKSDSEVAVFEFTPRN